MLVEKIVEEAFVRQRLDAFLRVCVKINLDGG
jgi:hypothetical protein